MNPAISHRSLRAGGAAWSLIAAFVGLFLLALATVAWRVRLLVAAPARSPSISAEHAGQA